LLHARVIKEEFCDGIEMKFIPPLGRIQQVGAPETAAKSVALCFTFGYELQGLRHKFVCHNH